MNASQPYQFAVLVTRPQAQAQHLCQLIEDAGMKAICFPTMVIQAPINVAQIEKILTKLNHYHWAIFVSQNAVSAVKAFWPDNTAIKVAAVGEATKKALATAGIKVDASPSLQFSSEGLLALPEFQAVNAEKIIIFAGVGGRTLLAETLTARGAVVTKIACYQRLLPNIDMASHIKSWQEKGLDVIIVTSSESLLNLVELVGRKHRAWLVKKQLLVISERLCQCAINLGFVKTPWIAEQVSDVGLLGVLKQHVS